MEVIGVCQKPESPVNTDMISHILYPLEQKVLIFFIRGDKTNVHVAIVP